MLSKIFILEQTRLARLDDIRLDREAVRSLGSITSRVALNVVFIVPNDGCCREHAEPAVSL